MTTTPADTSVIRLPKTIIEGVRAIAREHDRSLSAELRVALSAYIKQHEGDGQ